MTQKQHVMHGRDHQWGGADPVAIAWEDVGSGGGGGGGGPRQLVALWEGLLPIAAESGPVWRIPRIAGSSVTFNLTSAFARIENPGAGATTVLIERSPGGGAFTATAIATLMIAASSYEDTDTPTATVTSGELVRIRWTALGAADPSLYTVQLEGTEI
jgi:hypothetical protein